MIKISSALQIEKKNCLEPHRPILYDCSALRLNKSREFKELEPPLKVFT